MQFEQKLAAKTEQRAATTASDDRSSAQIHEIYRKVCAHPRLVG